MRYRVQWVVSYEADIEADSEDDLRAMWDEHEFEGEWIGRELSDVRQVEGTARQ